LDVPAGKTADYEIIYNPLSMTKNDVATQIKEETHEGTLFFATPDGSALLYNLIGRASKPNPSKVFDITDLKAKKSSKLDINVKNWLKTTQRFKVTWDVANNDQTILIKGANTIDIMGDAIKDYKLFIYCLKPGQGKVTVNFKNETTGEYLYYLLNLTIGPTDLLGKYDLTSPVREGISKVLLIENPLAKSVAIAKEHIFCDNDNVTFNLQSDSIAKESEFGIELVFRPLVVGEKVTNVLIKHPELGEFPYQLKLAGTQSNVQRSMTFKSPLGTELVQTFKFISYVKKPTTYTVRVDKVGSKTVVTDPKAKAPPVQVDFYPLVLANNTFNAPAAETPINISAPFII